MSWSGLSMLTHAIDIWDGALFRSIDAELALANLGQAVAPTPDLIYHSDRGVQDASTVYPARLERVEARIIMAAVGNIFENVEAEGFLKTLKCAEVSPRRYQTFQNAEANLGRFIDDVYNEKRLHSSPKHASPAEFDAAHAPGRQAR